MDPVTVNIMTDYVAKTRCVVAKDQPQQEEEEEEVRAACHSLSLPCLYVCAGACRGVDEAMSLVSEMERSLGLKPEAVTHNILLDALIKSAQLDRAVEYFGQITTAAGLPGRCLTSLLLIDGSSGEPLHDHQPTTSRPD